MGYDLVDYGGAGWGWVLGWLGRVWGAVLFCEDVGEDGGLRVVFFGWHLYGFLVN